MRNFQRVLWILGLLCFVRVDIFAAGGLESSQVHMPTSLNTSTCCLGNYSDDFSDGIDSPFLRFYPTCGTIYEDSGYLIANFPDSCAIYPAHASFALDSAYEICGDFNIQFDFDLGNWLPPIPAGPSSYRYFAFDVLIGSNQMSIGIYKYTNTGGCTPYSDFYKAWFNNPDNCASTLIATGDTQGKLRITRNGTTLESYYWSGGSWVVARTETCPTSPAIFLVGTVVNPGTGGAGSGSRIKMDSLIIQSDLPTDADADTVPDCRDNCPLVSNANQLDTDSDTVGDSCDICPTYFNPLQQVIKPGDANASGTYALGDVISIVNYIFNKPGCTPLPLCWLSNLLCRGDWNASGTVALDDVIRGVNYIFNKPGGPWTPVPVGACCVSPT